MGSCPCRPATPLLVVLGLIAGTASNSAQTASDATGVVIENVTIVHVDPPSLIPRQTVLISGGRIAQLISPTSAPIRPIGSGLKRIDGRGRFLMPALADMHVHVWQEEDFLLYLANGVTLLRNMNGSQTHLEWRDQLRRGRLLGPDLFTSGPTLFADPANAEEEVARQKAQGYDFLKLYHFMSIDGYRAVLAAARRHRMRAVGHRPNQVTSAEAARMGMETLEHLLGFALAVERKPSALRDELIKGRYSFRYTYAGVDIDESMLPAIVKELRSTTVQICPTLVAMDRWMPMSAAETLLSRPHMRALPPRLLDRWRQWNQPEFLADWTPDVHAKGKRARRVITKYLHDGGVPLLLGTDAGAYLVEPGYSVHDELAALTEAGLSPAQALRTATTQPAKYLGLAGEWGVIRQGARADVVLLARNPLERVEHAREPLGVAVRGRWFDAADLKLLIDRQISAH